MQSNKYLFKHNASSQKKYSQSVEYVSFLTEKTLIAEAERIYQYLLTFSKQFVPF